MRAFILMPLLAAGLAAPLNAESITLTGRFPAPVREMGYPRRIAIERVSGGDGTPLGFALERALAGAGRSVVQAGSPADALLSADVATEVQQSRRDVRRERCTEKSGDECITSVTETISCTARVIDVIADLRIVSGRGGALLYNKRKQQQDETRWCPQDARPASVESVVRKLIDAIAAETAHDITPYTENYTLRFYESRDGMPKPLAERFKAAIAQSRRDMPGACATLAALDREMPHFALAYDAGLCAEAAGDYSGAQALYTRARDLRPRDAADFLAGLDRTTRLIARAEDDKAGRTAVR